MEIKSISTICNRSYYSTEEVEMINILKADPSWAATAERACEKLLQENLTYTLSQDPNGQKFIVHYLKADRSMDQATFVLEKASGKWFFRNGCDCRSSNYKDVINYILQPH
jgi:hypothetical protein